MKRATSTAMALILATSAAPALAQATYTFADIDADGNLELSSAEFERVARDTYGRWDTNSDQRIEDVEFYTGAYHDWDTDSDGALTSDEYSAGWDGWFGDGEPVAYGTLDADADGIVSEDEFGAGLGNTSAFGTWDTAGDGFLDEGEFSAGLYSAYDMDDNDIIAESEYAGYDRVGAVSADAGVVGTADETVKANIVSLSDWRYDELYADGVSAEDFIDEMEVYGLTGDEIGDVEDIIVGTDGKILSVIAEVGGLWDIGDTHVSIPWSDVELRAEGDGIIVPVTEDTVEDYGLFNNELLTATTAAAAITAEVDDAEVGPRAWRVSELIGDYARLRQDDGYRDYGYVNDVILRDGQVAAVVVNADVGYGARGAYAYPYYGYGAGYGWGPGNQYYDLPYAENDIGEMEAFDYDRLGAG
ncbi:PRC-barrel domain-containing protein [Aurantimonas sp. HBX-1]|uniref:PRC-barrel domain-containing protein n=1 Tax=Aurantimonas sp. HBX-1 TaxID=2906072 RepID=UPI001F3153A0|nr:PRC-barrel domain-containing protein [Aurantimonas sp. HBX-1]UIJ73324.1 PRC-barrel domain-containing protein [Aurantimonas sp. HBX-1]